ncbi:MAG TPA: ABC transporter substrate-binding protein [Myxococcota bacterium]|nr:ABC transporter substrate-binding protein [Myxococcota bacterium]HNZ03164.1 ABC transporter substrate-binding protein [Myxococcota bacterium]HOH77112.1 ABC transporter substrate-binding protein [Myxococcota bacterium]
MYAPFRACLRFSSRISFLAVVLSLGIVLSVNDVVATESDPRTAPDNAPGQSAADCADCVREPPLVAILLPTSGSHSFLGMAVHDELLEKLSPIKGVRVAVFDTAGTAQGARRAAAEAVERQAAMMVGGIGDRETAEISQIATREGVLFLTMGRSRLAAAATTVFQTVASREAVNRSLLASLAASGKVPECAIVIRRADAFGEAELAAFRGALAGTPISFIGSRTAGGDSFDEGAFSTEVTSMLSSHRASHACSTVLLHLAIDVPIARRLVDYLRFAGFFEQPGCGVVLSGTSLFNAPGLVAQSGQAFLGLVFVDIDVESSFGGRDDRFRAEASDLSDFAARAATILAEGGAVPPPALMEGAVVSGRTGNLVVRNGRVEGHRLKFCTIGARGIDCLAIEGPSDTREAAPAPEARGPDAPVPTESTLRK